MLKKQDQKKNMNNEDEDIKEVNVEELNDYCEECKKEDKNVKSNLIMFGYKICNSCKTSVTFRESVDFPILKFTIIIISVFRIRNWHDMC